MAKKEKKKSGKKSAPESSSECMPTFKHVAKKKLTTGKGASAAEIGKSLVELFNAGKSAEVEKTWHHKKIESIEADGSVYLGRKGIAEKNAWWYANFEVHSAQAEGPFVGATGFVVHFTVDVTPKNGQRMTSREVGVYTVSKGKIIREEFMSLAGP
ncbi:MAG: SnoaL-like domain-containing protein [Phycisphaerales bacterium]